MITLLREIRKKLITEGRLSKYLIYAIGEILLVVVGILIALAINNWNEDRKDRAVEVVILDDLLNEFESNYEEFKKVYKFKSETKEKWANYLPQISDSKSSIETRSLSRPNNGAITLNISNSVLNSVLTSGTLDIITYDSLKYLVSSWNDHLEAYKEIESRHINLVENNLRQYEIKNRIIKDYKGLQFSFDNPFFDSTTKQENLQRMIKMNEDLEYQNLLMLNFMWLHLINQRCEALDTRFKEIISALTNELKSKTK